jgi:hypothetical protein
VHCCCCSLKCLILSSLAHSLRQDFWKCYNNLPPIEKLRFKSSFHLMKSGISPLWEDPKNANGGFWAMRVRKDDTSYVWKEVILALIGEQFEGSLGAGDEICGLTVSIRQHDDIIRIWNTNASANSSGLLGRLKEIIPKAELRSPFYKGTTTIVTIITFTTIFWSMLLADVVCVIACHDPSADVVCACYQPTGSTRTSTRTSTTPRGTPTKRRASSRGSCTPSTHFAATLFQASLACC